MRRWILALTILVAAPAGCLGADDDASGSQTPGEQAPPPQDPLPTYFLDGDMGLVERFPSNEEPERVPVGSFYTDWTAGDEQPTWTGTATPVAYRVSAVTLTFYYTADQAVATTGPQGEGFPEFVVYLGTEQAPMAWASLQGPDVVRSGDVVRVTGELSLPRGGLVLPAGVDPVVKIAPVQGQGEEENELVILVDSTETPSRAVLEGERIVLSPVRSERMLDTSGILAGSAYATGPQEDTTADSHEVEVPPDARGLTASLQRVQGAGVADIDLEVLGPDGEVVARSVTPEDDEGVALYRPNVEAIGTGTWTLRVVNYGNVAVEYELQAELLHPVQQA